MVMSPSFSVALAFSPPAESRIVSWRGDPAGRVAWLADGRRRS